MLPLSPAHPCQLLPPLLLLIKSIAHAVLNQGPAEGGTEGRSVG